MPDGESNISASRCRRGLPPCSDPRYNLADIDLKLVEPMSDEILPLAVSMQSNKGVYALLLGSGVSRSAGIPTGWQIVEDLIRQIASTKDVSCEPDPAAWYAKEFGTQAEYTKIIDQLAKSPSERSQLLRPYFEPNEDERQRGLKLPTSAHRAIAHLVSEGYVRVIVTTNFDRLLESALEAEGVSAAVLPTPDSIDGAMPLAHTKCSVLKLHGDYRDTRIMNTVTEVAVYDDRTNKLLDQILDEYGLIVCGWSAEWDAALRAAIKRCSTQRFTTYWATLGDLKDSASELVKLRRAQVIEIDSADMFFTEVSEKVDSLSDLSRQRPLSAAVAVETLKRYLPDAKYRIELHDLVAAERERLHKQLFSNRFPTRGVQPTSEEIAKRMREYESATEVIRDMIIAGCYYGEQHHVPLWVGCIERIGSLSEPEAGYDVWTTLRRYPALLLLYGGGIAAIAAGRYGTLADLLTKPRIRIGNREHLMLERINSVRVLDPALVQALPGMARRKTPMSQYLETLLRESVRDLLPDDPIYPATFDRFEYLLAMAYMDQSDNLSWAPAGCFAWRYELDNESSPARSVARDISKMGEEWPMLKAGMFGGSLPRAHAVKSALDQFISRLAPQLMWR
jgi:SIR2-like protein